MSGMFLKVGSAKLGSLRVKFFFQHPKIQMKILKYFSTLVDLENASGFEIYFLLEQSLCNKGFNRDGVSLVEHPVLPI
jgi:hypothetical protein